MTKKYRPEWVADPFWIGPVCKACCVEELKEIQESPASIKISIDEEPLMLALAAKPSGNKCLVARRAANPDGTHVRCVCGSGLSAILYTRVPGGRVSVER